MADTSQQIIQALEALKESDYSRLAVYADRCAAHLGGLRGGREGKDYLQEALEQTLSEKRTWNTNYSIKQHLNCVIMSIVKDHAKHLRSKRYREPILESCFKPILNNKEEPVIVDLDDFPSSRETPESEYELKYKLALMNRATNDLARILADDPLVPHVFGAQLDGLTGPQIQEKFGITAKEYAAKDRRMKRTMKGIVKQLRKKEGL